MSTNNTSSRSFPKLIWHKLSTNVPLLLCFFIPVVVMLLVFLCRGIYPFGDRCFLRTDLYHQYAPFFQELMGKLKNGESLFYSWDIGGGSNFLALFAYYLSSPLNFFLYLCPDGYVIEFITYGIVLKLGLSGFTMGYYLKKHTGKNSFGIPMFASFYALSGYMAAYSWNIMWLDCLLLFPLVILGVEKLMKEDKCLLYCITLSLSIITNYYIAIMICIYLVFYFIVLVLTEKSRRHETLKDQDTGRLFIRTHYINYPKKIWFFSLYSLLAGGISAVLLLPAYKALLISASASSTFPKTFTSYFSILEMMNRHLDNVEVHLGLDHWPNIFCGVAILIFVPLYIMNKKYSWREKSGNLFLLLFLLASFSMNVLNYIWHGFHYPNSLPARQSFIYIFIILAISYKGFLGLKDRTIAQITGSIAGAIGFVVLCEALYTKKDTWNFTTFYVSILFIMLYGILAYVYRRFKKHIIILTIIALLAVFGENFMNTNITSVTTVSRVDYTKYDDDYTALYETAQSLTNSLFFRCEKLKLRTKNDGSWYQYPSTSVFSSTANANLSTFYKKLGMEAATNAYSKTGATLLIDMLFSVKYEFSNITYPDNGLRRLAASSGDVKMYENIYSLPLGYMVPSNFNDIWYADGSNPVDTLNGFISASTGYANTLKALSLRDNDESKTVASVEVEQDGYYYAYVLNSNIDEVTTLIKSSNASRTDQSNTHTSLKRRFILDIGYAVAGDTITITSKTEDQDLLYMLYVLDEDVMKSAYNVLSANGLKLTSFSSDLVEGTITADTDGLMFTTIAYEDGWTLYVDDKETDITVIKDAMIGVSLTSGTHTIKLKYVPSGLKPGIILTLVSILALVIVTLIRFLLKKFLKAQSAFVEDTLLSEEKALSYLSQNISIPTAVFYGYEDDEDDDDDEENDENTSQTEENSTDTKTEGEATDNASLVSDDTSEKKEEDRDEDISAFAPEPSPEYTENTTEDFPVNLSDTDFSDNK